jgi:ABC-type nitrate/sulfonate/bicarbonate transport system permease component
MGATVTQKSAMPGLPEVGAKIWEHRRTRPTTAPNDKGPASNLAFRSRVAIGYLLAVAAAILIGFIGMSPLMSARLIPSSR